MEQLQPQIHEQKAENEAGEEITSLKPLAETARDRLKEQIARISQDLKRGLTQGEKTPEEVENALRDLAAMAEGLTGETLARLELEAFEDAALDEIEDRYNAGTADAKDVARGLAGMDSDRAWALRRQLIERRGELFVVRGLAGVDSEAAWEIRERLLSQKRGYDEIAVSLAGIDSDRAWEIRNELATMFTRIRGEKIAQSLIGIDSPRAWEMRKMLCKRGDAVAVSVLESLAGLDSPKAWKIRNDADEIKKAIVLRSLIGLDSPQAWECREQCKAKDLEYDMANGLAGLDSPRAQEFRAELATASNPLILSMAGLMPDRAEEIKTSFGDSREIPVSLINGDYLTSIGWRAAKGLLPYQIEQKNQKIKT